MATPASASEQPISELVTFSYLYFVVGPPRFIQAFSVIPKPREARAFYATSIP